MIKKRIIIKPRAGLANRMRLISSCLFLRNDFHVNISMIWEVNSGLNAQYHQLFELNQDIELIKKWSKFNLILSRKGLLSNKIKFIVFLTKLWNSFIIKLIGVDYCLYDDDLRKGYDYVRNIIESKEVVFIYSCEEFVDYQQGIRSFEPISSIRENIKNTSVKFDDNTVGIHIRRTDNSASINKSPDYLFENKIEYFLQKNNNIKFFLATDDPSVEYHFLSKYPDNIILYPKTYGRNSLQGIKDALVELCLLSKTSIIFGSFWSSYSEMASRIGGIKLHVLSLEDGTKSIYASPGE